MDKILIKETKTVHELIIKAIASCRKTMTVSWIA